MRIIALAGCAGAGKDTVGALLRTALPGSQTFAFADRLKQLLKELFDLTDDDLYTAAGKQRATAYHYLQCPSCKKGDSVKVTQGAGYCAACDISQRADFFQVPWTVRKILQHVGTEGLRAVDPDVWVRLTLRQIAAAALPAGAAAIITDLRFAWEYAKVVEAGGEVWQIRRPLLPAATVGFTAHASEQELVAFPDSMFAQIIVNDATLATLAETVTAALRKA